MRRAAEIALTLSVGVAVGFSSGTSFASPTDPPPRKLFSATGGVRPSDRHCCRRRGSRRRSRFWTAGVAIDARLTARGPRRTVEDPARGARSRAPSLSPIVRFFVLIEPRSPAKAPITLYDPTAAARVYGSAALHALPSARARFRGRALFHAGGGRTRSGRCCERPALGHDPVHRRAAQACLGLVVAALGRQREGHRGRDEAGHGC